MRIQRYIFTYIYSEERGIQTCIVHTLMRIQRYIFTYIYSVERDTNMYSTAH